MQGTEGRNSTFHHISDLLIGEEVDFATSSPFVVDVSAELGEGPYTTLNDSQVRVLRVASDPCVRSSAL